MNTIFRISSTIFQLVLLVAALITVTTLPILVLSQTNSSTTNTTVEPTSSSSSSTTTTTITTPTTTSTTTTSTTTSTTTTTTTTTEAPPAPKNFTNSSSLSHSSTEPTESLTRHSNTVTNSSSKTKSFSHSLSNNTEEITESTSLNVTESNTVPPTNSSEITQTKTHQPTLTENQTESTSHEVSETGNTSTKSPSSSASFSESEHANSTTLEATDSRELTKSNDTISESITESSSLSKSNSTAETLTKEETQSGTVSKSNSSAETFTKEGTKTDNETLSRTLSQSKSGASPSSSKSKSEERTKSSELTLSKSFSESINTPSQTETHDETNSLELTLSVSKSISKSEEPTTTHELTESPSLSETTWSRVRVINPIALPTISALGLPVTPQGPLFEIEGSPQLQLDKEEWIPARKFWPLEFDIPKSQQTRGCRVFIQEATALINTDNIFPTSSTSSSSCPVTPSSSVDPSLFRVVKRTNTVKAAFGQCSFDTLTIDWRPDIISCLSQDVISSRLDSTYRTPPINVTLRFCANVSGLASRQQPLPRQEEICQDSWTVMSSCPVPRENLLYSIDKPITRISTLSSSSSITYNVEGTWFHPPEKSQHECRFTDNSGQEIFREPATWVDVCRIQCSINSTRLNDLQQQVTVRSASTFINDASQFKIEDSIQTPGFAGFLSVVRDDYLFVSSCPGLSLEAIRQLNYDTTQTADSKPSCQSLINDVQNRIFPVNSALDGNSKRNGCPIRLVGKPITPTFWPPSGQILAPVVLSDNNNNNNNGASSSDVLAVLQGTIEVAFCDLAGNRAYLEDAEVGPRSMSSVWIYGQQHSQSSSSSSSSSIRNETGYGTQIDFTNSTFTPLQIKNFVFPSSTSSPCPDVEDIPLLFVPNEYFGWVNFTVSDNNTSSNSNTSSSSPSSSSSDTTRFTPELTYCVKYDADIPTDLQILNDGDILTVGDTDIGMPVAPVVSATNRIGNIISGNVERFRLRLRAEIVTAPDPQNPSIINSFSGYIFDQALVREFPLTVPIPFNTTGTGFGVRISLWSASGNQSTSSVLVFGSSYPRSKNITVRFCPFLPGNPQPFVDRVVAEYSNRELCGNETRKTLTDAIFQNSSASTQVLVHAGSISYIDPVACQFSNVDDLWSFTNPGYPAQVVSSCEVICQIPHQRFPIRALSAFAFNASGSWVSTRTFSSPPGMFRLKVGSAWIGPVSMDVYGTAASVILLSFPQTIYIRLQKTILQPITVTIADAATNVLTGNDDIQRTVFLTSDEGTAVLLNGTSTLKSSAETCQPPSTRNAVATLSNIFFVNPQPGEYNLRIGSNGLSPLSVGITLRNPDPDFRHYLRFGGKVPPLSFTDPSTDGTNFGKFPIPLHVEACIRGTQVPDSEVSGFIVFVRVTPLDESDPIDTSKGLGLAGCEPQFGNCGNAERGVVVFDQLRFFGTPGKKYKLTIMMSNSSLDVLPLYFTVHTPDCDISASHIVVPDRIRLSSSSSSSQSSYYVEVHARYFPIPRTAYSGWVNQSQILDDRYRCSFAGSVFPARFIDTCTIRCFVDDYLFYARRRLVNGSSSDSAGTSPFSSDSELTGDAKIANSSWMITAANMTLPSNVSLCGQDGMISGRACCFDEYETNNSSSSSSIRCSQPTSDLVRVLIPDYFNGNNEQTSAARPIEGGSGILYVVGAARSALVSQPQISSKYKIFERDQIVPVDPVTAQVEVAVFDLVIVDSEDQALLGFDQVQHHVLLKSISRRGVPVLNLPANWSQVLDSTVPSPFVRQHFPGNCLENIPGSASLFKGAESRDPKTIYELKDIDPSPPDHSGIINFTSSSTTTLTTTTTTTTTTSTTVSSTSTAPNSPQEISTTSATSSASSSDNNNNNNVPIVQNITGIKTEGWYTANGSLRIEDLVFVKPAAGTYDVTFTVEIENGVFVDASFSLHIVGGEPVDTCLWTFGGEGLRNPLNSVITPQPMFMFLDAAGNIYQPLRQNPNLTAHLGLISENFVRSVKQVPFLMFKSKLREDSLFRFTLQNQSDDDSDDNENNMTTSTTFFTTTSSLLSSTSTTIMPSSSDINDENSTKNEEERVYSKSTIEFANHLHNLSITQLVDLASSPQSELSFEIPELEFIEPQGIGLLTYMFRSLKVNSNFSFDFKVEFFSTSRFQTPKYWKNFNSSIISTPVFESEDCVVTDYAVPETSECRQCPSGAKSCIGSIFPFCFICNGTTTSLVQQSYWRFAPESTIAYFCSKSNCLGPSVLGTCDEKSVPMSPKCQVCAPGFSKALDGGCADCGEEWVSVVIVVVTVIAAAIIVGALVTASLRAHEASSSSSVVLLSKIFVNFLQVLGMLGEFGVGFPGFVKATLMGVSIGSGAAGIGLNPIYCLFPEFTFYHVLVLHLVLPVLVLLILAAVLLLRGWLVSRRYRRRVEAKKRRQEKIERAQEKAEKIKRLKTLFDEDHEHTNFVDIDGADFLEKTPDDDGDNDSPRNHHLLFELGINHNHANDDAGEEMKTQHAFSPKNNDDDQNDDNNHEKDKTSSSSGSLSSNENNKNIKVSSEENQNDNTIIREIKSPDPIRPDNEQKEEEEENDKQNKKSSFFDSVKSIFSRNKKKNNQQEGDENNNDEEDDNESTISSIDDEDEGELGPPPELFQGRIFLTCAIIVMFLLYQSILTQTIETFRCEEVETTDTQPPISYMMADPRVPCVGRGYEEIIAIAAWGLFLFGTFVPLLSLIAILHTARTQGWSTANDVFAFLINGFRLECWYWELVIVFRKVVIRVLLAVIDDDMLQALLGVWFLTAMFIIHAYRAPYVRTLHNNAESLSLLTTIMVLNFGMLLQRTQEMTQEICGLTCNILSLVLVIVLGVIVFFFAANIVRAFYDHLIEVLGVDRPDGRKVIVWRNVKRAVGSALGREDKLPTNFSDYSPQVLEPHIGDMLGMDLGGNNSK